MSADAWSETTRKPKPPKNSAPKRQHERVLSTSELGSGPYSVLRKGPMPGGRRKNAWHWVRDYHGSCPTLEQIQREHGGGEYAIRDAGGLEFVQFVNDPPPQPTPPPAAVPSRGMDVAAAMAGGGTDPVLVLLLQQIQDQRAADAEERARLREELREARRVPPPAGDMMTQLDQFLGVITNIDKLKEKLGGSAAPAADSPWERFMGGLMEHAPRLMGGLGMGPVAEAEAETETEPLERQREREDEAAEDSAAVLTASQWEHLAGQVLAPLRRMGLQMDGARLLAVGEQSGCTSQQTVSLLYNVLAALGMTVELVQPPGMEQRAPEPVDEDDDEDGPEDGDIYVDDQDDVWIWDAAADDWEFKGSIVPPAAEAEAKAETTKQPEPPADEPPPVPTTGDNDNAETQPLPPHPQPEPQSDGAAAA